MSEQRPPELDPPAQAVDDVDEEEPTSTRPTVDEQEPTSMRPTVDEMSEWSFPASDPPATWTWDVGRPRRSSPGR